VFFSAQPEEPSDAFNLIDALEKESHPMAESLRAEVGRRVPERLPGVERGW
jgi:hypothetical protein